MKSLEHGYKAVVIGAHGGIGAGLVRQLKADVNCAAVYGFARRENPDQSDIALTGLMDTTQEASIEQAAASLDGTIDMVINATGFLHDPETGQQPERSIRHLDMAAMNHVFAVNCFGPALVMKHFIPKLHRQKRALFGSLSARVGSISDNRLGGWYSYRAAKAAHNMMIKNAALEAGFRYQQAVILGLHPGTVDSALSKPFQSNVAADKLFSPAQSAAYLLSVLDAATPEQSGSCLAWDGQTITP